jgi:hypothetical protein
VAIFGDADSTTKQGNGNTANANVGQSNSAEQSQSSEQKQSFDQEGSTCCNGGQSQTGEQSTYFGDQASSQTNQATVEQKQGNGNVNISPAVAIFGDAETETYQGNGNEANANVHQSNQASQSQDSTQRQYFDQDGGNCCGGGQSQTGTQSNYFGDQASSQTNQATVEQKQGNENENFSPAFAFGKEKGRESSCYSKCESSKKPGYGHSFGGDAETTTYQGNGNEANANVGQSNSADQAQTSAQYQSLIDVCKGLVYR